MSEALWARKQRKTQCILPTQLRRYHILAFLWTVLLWLFSRSFFPPFSSLIVHFLTISISSQSFASLVAHSVESACNAGDWGFNLWFGNIPWRRERLPTQVFLPGEFHGQKSLSMGLKRVRHDWMTDTSSLLLLPKMFNLEIICVSVLVPSLSILLCIVLVCACSISSNYHLL